MCLQEFLDRARRRPRAAGERNVRMKTTHCRLDPRRDHRFFDFLLKLKKSRVTGADSGPQYACVSLRREATDGLKLEDKRLNSNGRQTVGKGLHGFGPGLSDKPKSKVVLLRRRPPNSGCGRFQPFEVFYDRPGHFD